MRLYPVIMCGGAGSRLWPTSQPSSPKQFLPFVGEKTLFRQTVERVCGVEGFQKLIVVAGKGHANHIKEQVGDIKDVVMLLEPQGRDSAPAIAAATAWIMKNDPKGIAAIFASDHYIPDIEIFRAAIKQAACAAQYGRIVTLGIVPSFATSAYGYIEAGEKTFPENEDCNAVCDVTAFVEKPDIETAKKYIGQGYLWNSGNFVFSAQTMQEELRAFVPDIWERVCEGIEQATEFEGGFVLGEPFLTATKISIDYAVMEKTKSASVLPVDLNWSDVGAWDAVMALGKSDNDGNVVMGNGIMLDTENSYIRANKTALVAAIGVKDLVIVAEDDAVLVCHIDQTQKVKTIVDKLKNDKPKKDKLAPIEKSSLATVKTSTLKQIAHDYKKWLFTSALPLWWAIGADHKGWGFHEYIDIEGNPTKTPRRMRVQARQIYVYAKAGAMGWHGPWQEAVEHGLKGLYQYYQTSDGRFKTLVDHDGAPMDETILLYDQAFVILALSALHPFKSGAQQIALSLLSCVEAKMRHSAGGFMEAGAQKFQSNPHMHLFEAALGWIESGQGDLRWNNLADEIATLALTHFIAPMAGDGTGGFIREFFQKDWTPAQGEMGRIVEPGHQFEWAWLLERYYRISGNDKMLVAAKRLYDVGNESVDVNRNVALDSLEIVQVGLVAKTQNARLWPQTERLKAALVLSDDQPNIINISTSLGRYMDMSVVGLWRDNLLADNHFLDEPVTGSSLYHILSAIEQLQISSQK